MYLAYAGHLLRRGALWIALCALLGLGAAGLVLLTGQSYHSTSFLAVQPSADQAGVRAVQPDRFVKTVGQRLLSDSVLATAAKSSGGSATVAELRQAITVTGGTADDVLQFDVTGKTADEAADRTKGLLAGLAAAPTDRATTQLLWTTEPSARLKPATLLGGGLLGGAVLGALGTLLLGALRRPVLAPQFLGVRGVEAVSLGGARGHGSVDEEVARLVGRLRAGGHQGDARELVIHDLESTDRTRLVAAAIARATSPDLPLTTSDEAGPLVDGRRRTVLMLGELGGTTEAEVERERHQLDGVADDYLLVLAPGRGR